MRRFERWSAPRTWLWHDERPRELRKIEEEEQEALIVFPAWLLELFGLERA